MCYLRRGFWAGRCRYFGRGGGVREEIGGLGGNEENL